MLVQLQGKIMNELRAGELGKVCSVPWEKCKFCIPLSSECTFSENCADQIPDNYDDYLKELEDGCYE